MISLVAIDFCGRNRFQVLAQSIIFQQPVAVPCLSWRSFLARRIGLQAAATTRATTTTGQLAWRKLIELKNKSPSCGKIFPDRSLSSPPVGFPIRRSASEPLIQPQTSGHVTGKTINGRDGDLWIAEAHFKVWRPSWSPLPLGRCVIELACRSTFGRHLSRPSVEQLWRFVMKGAAAIKAVRGSNPHLGQLITPDRQALDDGAALER